MTAVCVAAPQQDYSATPSHKHDHALQAHLLDSYSDVTCLSQSASCSVWLVTAPDTQDKQVLKIFPVDQQASYRREAAISFGMVHPNVIKCLDTFLMPGGMSCLAYEYATGGNLATLFDGRQADLPSVRAIVEDILGGVQHLHSQRYIHCDIKPANILVSRLAFEKRWWYKLGDLGSAATLKEAQSGRYGVGSPAYCAPERLYNQFGFSSDIYSLGILTFQLLTGRLPFMGEVDAVHRAHLTQPLPLGDIQDPVWREWLERATHKSPRDRFETAADALDALKNGLTPSNTQSTVQSTPQSTPVPVLRLSDVNTSQPQSAAAAASTAIAQPETPAATASSAAVSSVAVAGSASVVWSDLGDISSAPRHHEVIAGADAQSIFLVSDVGVAMLQLPGGGLSAVTSAKPPYATFAGRIIYSSGGSITEVVPKTQARTTLCEHTNAPVALAVNDALIGFVDHQRIVLQRKSDTSVCLALKHRHYAMDPLLALGRNSFVVTAGLANNEVWHRHINGDVIAKLSVDGICIAMCSIDASGSNEDRFLVICTSLAVPDILSVYILQSDAEKLTCRLACSSLVVATCSTGMAYVAANGCVTWLSGNFESSVISQPVTNLYALALSTPGDCCFLSSRKDGKTLITRKAGLPEQQIHNLQRPT